MKAEKFTINEVGTFTATIYVGLKERDTEILHSIGEVWLTCQKYVDSVGLCVSVTETQFVYTGGMEIGASIGFINYPRFEDDEESIKLKALHLASILMHKLGQYRVTVVMPKETIMLSNESIIGADKE